MTVIRFLNFDSNNLTYSASIFAIGAIFGGLVSGYLGLKIGPKRSLTLLSLVDFCHWVLMATASNLEMMLTARFLAGLSAAAYSPNITIYVAEISEICHRGILLGLTVPIMGLGVLAVYAMGDQHHHETNLVIYFRHGTSSLPTAIKILKRQKPCP